MSKIEGIPAYKIKEATGASLHIIENIVCEYKVINGQLIARHGYNSPYPSVPTFDEIPTGLQFGGKDVPYYTDELEELNATTQGPKLFEFPPVNIGNLFVEANR